MYLREFDMKFIQMLVAAVLLIFMGSAFGEKPQQVIEQNLDTNGDIKVAIQNTNDNPVPVIIKNGVDFPVPVEVKNTIEANITGGEMDVNVVSAIPCEAPVRYQFVGVSTELFTGSWGIITYTMSGLCLFFHSGNTIRPTLSYAPTGHLRRSYYAFTSGLPTDKPCQVIDTLTTPC
jgi:hypothetical protein